MPALYVGLMSGTSLDGIDAVLVEIDETRTAHLDAITAPMPEALRGEILELIGKPAGVDLRRLGALDARLGELFASAALELLSRSRRRPADIRAIGSHGQTLWHQPDSDTPFTLQIGDPNRIAERTGITTVADFRRRDMAAGGQGAPLVPAFHHARFASPGTTRVIVNIGGMANITILPALPERAPAGFDTGPGNILMDLHALTHLGRPHDASGAWAASGQVDDALLATMLADPYFSLQPPKTTGREHFNASWLQAQTDARPHTPPADIQATLTELTARSIRDAIRQHAPDCGHILICGGGAHNLHLMHRMQSLAAPLPVASTATCGVAPEWVEGTAFAWLADRTLRGLPGNLPSVTGARHPVILGTIYPGRL